MPRFANSCRKGAKKQTAAPKYTIKIENIASVKKKNSSQATDVQRRLGSKRLFWRWNISTVQCGSNWSRSGRDETQTARLLRNKSSTGITFWRAALRLIIWFSIFYVSKSTSNRRHTHSQLLFASVTSRYRRDTVETCRISRAEGTCFQSSCNADPSYENNDGQTACTYSPVYQLTGANAIALSFKCILKIALGITNFVAVVINRFHDALDRFELTSVCPLVSVARELVKNSRLTL